MDGLLYPGVVAIGLAALLILAFGEAHDNWFWDRIMLGAMTLAVYAASYMAFKDVDEKDYKLGVFVFDLVEVVIVFICFNALGLAEPGHYPEISYGTFLLALGLDILLIQTGWRMVALEGAKWWHGFFTRAVVVALLAIGLDALWPTGRSLLATAVILLVGLYEFVWRLE